MIDRTMTEDAMLRHILIAHIRDELDAMILCQATTLRTYVDAQLGDDEGSRQVPLEQSAAFLAWLTIAMSTRAHLEDGLCWVEAPEPCDIHELHDELEALGVRDWQFNPADFFAGKEFYLNPIEPGLPLGTTGDGRVIHLVDEVQHYMKAAKSGYGKSVIVGGQTTEISPAHPANDPFFTNTDDES